MYGYTKLRQQIQDVLVDNPNAYGPGTKDWAVIVQGWLDAITEGVQLMNSDREAWKTFNRLQHQYPGSRSEAVRTRRVEFHKLHSKEAWSTINKATTKIRTAIHPISLYGDKFRAHLWLETCDAKSLKLVAEFIDGTLKKLSWDNELKPLMDKESHLWHLSPNHASANLAARLAKVLQS